MSKIAWTDKTVNPGIYGCGHAGPGCFNCYAEKMAARLVRMGAHPDHGQVHMDGAEKGRWTGKVTVDYDHIAPAFAVLPKQKPKRVFVTSMADLWHRDVPYDFLDRVFAEEAARPHISFQNLTKRSGRLAAYAQDRARRGLAWPANAWVGVTTADQPRFNARVRHLREVPARVRFLSIEPQVGPVDVGGLEGIGWVIVGCESLRGRAGRPLELDWVRLVRDRCVAAGVPFFLKQLIVDGRVQQLPTLDGEVWAQFPRGARDV